MNEKIVNAAKVFMDTSTFLKYLQSRREQRDNERESESRKYCDKQR